MSRRIICLLIALYAIAFAFAAMAAIRWPSLMMLAGFMLDEDAMSGLAGIDWRELGLAYGAPYFLAALCLYASALSLSHGKRSSLLWYGMGCVAGFPCVFLVDFEPGWWQDPSAGEGAVAGAGAGALLIAIAMLELNRKPKGRAKELPTQPVENADGIAPSKTRPNKPVQRRKGPVPAAIARQRAAFAAEGRRMLQQQARRPGR